MVPVENIGWLWPCHVQRKWLQTNIFNIATGGGSC